MNVYKQRVLKLARACREARADMFNMGLVVNECGTPACAWGNYAGRRDLQDEFRLVHTQRSLAPSTMHIPSGQRCTIRDSLIQTHLGITAGEALELFNSDGCGDARTPVEAALYVEAFAARKWPEPQRTDSELVADLMARIGKQTIPDGEIASPEYARA